MPVNTKTIKLLIVALIMCVIAGEIWIRVTGALNVEGLELSMVPEWYGVPVDGVKGRMYLIAEAIRAFSILVIPVLLVGLLWRLWHLRRNSTEVNLP